MGPMIGLMFWYLYWWNRNLCSRTLEDGSRRERSWVQLVKVKRRPYEPEEYPSSNHNEDGSISKLVYPIQQTLVPQVKLQGLLPQAHFLPLLGNSSFSLDEPFTTALALSLLSLLLRLSSWPLLEPYSHRVCRRWHTIAVSGVGASTAATIATTATGVVDWTDCEMSWPGGWEDIVTGSPCGFGEVEVGWCYWFWSQEVEELGFHWSLKMQRVDEFAYPLCYGFFLLPICLRILGLGLMTGFGNVGLESPKPNPEAIFIIPSHSVTRTVGPHLRKTLEIQM